MTIRAISEFVPDWYVPVNSEGKELDTTEPKARFKLKPLTGFEFLQITPYIRDGYLVGDAFKITLQLGLLDWENILDQDDKPVAFSKDKLDILPAQFLANIAGEIVNRSSLNENKTKNS